MTKEDIGIPVVRVVVPGLEQCTMDKDRVGARARSLLV
jgi:ribosomal protein S12 methylthiotransferase accessory factor YcaO